jgi:hypothetical protein
MRLDARYAAMTVSAERIASTAKPYGPATINALAGLSLRTAEGQLATLGLLTAPSQIAALVTPARAAAPQ